MINKLSGTTSYITQMCSDVVIKCIAVITGLAVQFSFGDISGTLLTAILMLIIFDFITASIAIKMNKGKITSKKTFRTALKFVIYFMLISAGYFTELVIGTDLFISKTIMIFLAMTELVSIFENVEKIGYNVPADLYRKLKEIVNNK